MGVMDDTQHESDGSGNRTDPEQPPSLSQLAERVSGKQNRPAPTSGGAAPSSTDGGTRATTSTVDDSGFFFPADSSPDNDADSNESSPMLEPTGQELTDTPTDGRPDVGRDDTSDERFGSNAKTEAIIELIGDTQNLLLMGPSHSPADYNLCANLLVPHDNPPENLLLVTFEKSPDERLNMLEGHLGTLPDNIAMVNVGDATRSGSSEMVSTPGTGGIQIDNLSDSTDVQRMGLTINKHLSQWDDGGETALCFHSLSALLDIVEPKTVFRFLNVLLGRVRSGDIRAHYHIDPEAHDEQTLETYRPLFDERIRVEEDGSVSLDR